MTIGTMQLSEAVQHLIDTRLDTIDRMLLGRVLRQDRVAIVREVESQIFELLHERTGEELTRDDVLGVLARLDPPEAYLPEEGELDIPRRRVAPRDQHAAPPLARSRTAAKVSAVLGLSALGVVLFSPLLLVLAELLQSESVIIVFLFGLIAANISACVVGITLGVMGRRASAWGTTGIVTSIIALVMTLAATVFLALSM